MASTSEQTKPGHNLEPIGIKVRNRRRELGLTLQELADETNLSVGFISQLERDLTSPSLSSLATIARTLKAEIADFLVVPGGESSLTRSDKREPYTINEGSLIYERLTSRFPGHKLSGVIMKEEPGHRSPPMRHEGEEFFYVLEGSITCEVGGKRTILKEGDSIHFNSNELHSTWNHTLQTASILVICTMEIFGDTIRGNSEPEKGSRDKSGRNDN
ncbi:MAG: cupin domain-containing protein [Paracoccaceae bacterium]|nr:cupin domain-containing protein [Paracoccaceae bacterium]